MVRYRDLLSLTENHTLSWIDLYNQHLVEINDDSNDSIGPAVDDIQEVEVAPTGVNIEGTLSVPIFGVNVELEGESLKRLQRKLKYIGYFIVCRSIILVGDFGQLPPSISRNEAIQIQQVTRINNNNLEISYYHLRDGRSIRSDWELLMTRIPENIPESERKTSDATNVLTTWEEVDKINLNKLRLLNQPVAKIHGVHTGGSEASKAGSETAKRIETEI
ncbi:hypothetical protein RhiirA1_531139 [Rhizophagus irregularis]|uniref:Uncharacterized protein n=1 Tax=Rhizophagus irregularis TaxID=588596 RepID=A0A2N0SAE4_9GLOM|nr:hypothetical protein RhiirA1_531139 [Rhizophagus irregularis]